MIRVYFYNLINPQWQFNMVGMLFLFKKNVFEKFINVPPLWSGDTSLYDRDAVLSIICVRLPIYGQGVNHYIWSGCFLYFMKGTDTSTFPCMIGWFIDYPYMVRMMFQLHESYIYVPLYCPGRTSLYESIWSRCYLYFMQITSIYPSMILVLIPLWLDAVYILHLCSTHIWFGCTFLYGRDAVYVSWKINLCTDIWFGCTSPYSRDDIYISWEIRLYAYKRFGCTSLYGRDDVYISRKIHFCTHIWFGCTSLCVWDTVYISWYIRLRTLGWFGCTSFYGWVAVYISSKIHLHLCTHIII